MDIKNKIQELKIKLKELDPIIEKRFKTKKELQEYVEKNNEIYKKANEIHMKIQQLEWELMTPEEQEEQRKLEHFLKLKAKGDPFDPDEII